MYRGLPSSHPDNLPVATEMALEVLCLPIYPALESAQAELIGQLIMEYS
jgi:dTDP-4-amino-4,6-dideoxygalactose transaminase